MAMYLWLLLDPETDYSGTMLELGYFAVPNAFGIMRRLFKRQQPR